MVWFTRIFMLLSLISVFFVFANDNQYAEIPEKKTNDVKIQVVNKSESTTSSSAGAPKVGLTNKVLVEVTDAIEDEEEEDALVYTPAIAPATPQFLITSQSVHADSETLKTKPVDNDIKTSDTVSESKPKPEPDESVANKLLTQVIDGIDEGGHLTHTASIVPSRLVDTTFSTSTISQSVKTDNGVSVHINNSPKLEDMGASNLDQESEKLHLKANGNKHTPVLLSSEIVLNGISKLQLSPSRKEQYEEKSVKTPNDIVVNIGTMEKDTHDDSSKDNILETPLENIIGIDSVTLGNNGKKDNESTFPHQQLEQQPKHEGHITTKNESSTISEDKSNITPEISSVNNNASGNEMTLNKETEKDLVENDVAKSKSEGEKSDVEKAFEIKITDPSQPQPDKVVIEDGEGKPTKDEKKMLSFAEWKKRLDKEKAEEDIVVDTKSPIPKNKTIFKEKHKIRKNFASIDCGGKVVSANEEASNILSVLKEDKDEYMLNPCNVKAWFVVELCDRIQIDSIDLANFEMFSSTPETFNVYVTSRYPSGSWEKVGSFHAKPEKEIQTFVFEEKFYARYIKIEIKKYFGNEHYCPLSLLRVFGITEVEQFEDSDEHDNSPDESNPDDADPVAADRRPDANAANIFEAAKNVVADLVNGMAKKLSGKSNTETNQSGISKQGDLQSSMVVTMTALSKESINGDKNSTYYYKDSMMVGEKSVDWEMWYYYRHPKRTCSFADLKHLIKKIKATVYFNHSGTVFQMLSKSSGDSHINITPSKNIPITPHLNPTSKTISQNDVNVSFLKSEVTPSEVQKATQAIEKTNITEISVATPSLDVIPAETPTVEMNKESASTTAIGTSNIATTNLINNSLVPPPTQSSVEKPVYNEESVDILEFKVNNTLKGAVIAEKIIPNNSVALTNDTDTNTTVVPPDNKIAVDTKNVTDLNNINDSHGDSHVDNATDVKANGSESIEVQDVINPSASLEIEKPQSLTTPVSSDIIENTSSTVEITSNSQVKSNDKKSENVLEHSIEKDIQTAAKTTSGSKESIIAKLNAKVKALQANLTLSMMYLDEMSERYRTAVEEVDERHKKKNLALNATIQHQQNVVKLQTNLIANLTDQINNISFQIQNLTQTTQEQHQKIIETHATWVFLEITIILIFLLLCRSKPKPYSDVMDDGMDHQRRFSEPNMLNTDKWAIEKPLKKQLSDPTGISEICCNNQLQNVAFAKKRKRKKNMKSNVSEIEMNKSNVNSIPGTTEKAGLIFGRGLFNGIAGAFTRKKDSPEKLSRQADALLDNVSDKSCCDVTPLRKVKSSELPTINEDEDITVIERPKSCSYLDINSGYKNNKNSQRAAGRFG